MAEELEPDYYENKAEFSKQINPRNLNQCKFNKVCIVGSKFAANVCLKYNESQRVLRLQN